MNKVKFERVFAELADEPFKYGKNDCFHFTARLVNVWHGKDFRKLHPYKSKKGAEDYMDRFGPIEVLTTGTLGYPLASMDEIRDGDVVSLEVAKGQIGLGFVANGKAWFKTKSRVIAVDPTKCRMAWRGK